MAFFVLSLSGELVKCRFPGASPGVLTSCVWVNSLILLTRGQVDLHQQRPCIWEWRAPGAGEGAVLCSAGTVPVLHDRKGSGDGRWCWSHNHGTADWGAVQMVNSMCVLPPKKQWVPDLKTVRGREGGQGRDRYVLLFSDGPSCFLSLGRPSSALTGCPSILPSGRQALLATSTTLCESGLPGFHLVFATCWNNSDLLACDS